MRRQDCNIEVAHTVHYDMHPVDWHTSPVVHDQFVSHYSLCFNSIAPVRTLLPRHDLVGNKGQCNMCELDMLYMDSY
jgi:hypothetical protein